MFLVMKEDVRIVTEEVFDVWEQAVDVILTVQVHIVHELVM